MIFKNYIKLFFKNIKYLSISFGIFIVMLLVFSNQKNKVDEFKPVKLNIIINDEDKSEKSKDLINYLKEKHTIKEEELDEKDAKKIVFDGKADGYLEIKKDFEKNLKNNEKPVSLIASPKSTKITFFKIDLEKYLNYTLAGINSNVPKEEVEKTLKTEVDIKVVDSNLYTKNRSKEIYNFTLAMLSYVVFISIVSMFANLEAIFKNESLQKRMNLAPYSQRTQVTQQFLAQALLSMILTTIFILITMFSMGSLIPEKDLPYIIASVYLFSFTAIAFTQLLISITKDVKVIGGVSSAFSMTMAFSSGVFLPANLLPKGVVLFSKFMPQYYFVSFLNEIKFNNFLKFTASQLIFITFFILLGMFIRKYKLKEVA